MTPSERREETRGMLIFVILFILACVIWYFAWVVPFEDILLGAKN